MSKGMKAFWEWMEKNGYGHCGYITRKNYIPTYASLLMLEGYMREFIFDVLKAKLVSVTEWVVYQDGRRKQIYAGPYDFQNIIEEAFK